jgi:hypothetical protein
MTRDEMSQLHRLRHGLTEAVDIAQLVGSDVMPVGVGQMRDVLDFLAALAEAEADADEERRTVDAAVAEAVTQVEDVEKSLDTEVGLAARKLRAAVERLEGLL